MKRIIILIIATVILSGCVVQKDPCFKKPTNHEYNMGMGKFKFD